MSSVFFSLIFVCLFSSQRSEPSSESRGIVADVYYVNSLLWKENKNKDFISAYENSFDYGMDLIGRNDCVWYLQHMCSLSKKATCLFLGHQAVQTQNNHTETT